MSLVWQCDRCLRMSRGGDEDDPPDDWEIRTLPVRGSEGARSDMAYTLCRECDDSLYAWLNKPGDDVHDGKHYDGSGGAA